MTHYEGQKKGKIGGEKQEIKTREDDCDASGRLLRKLTRTRRISMSSCDEIIWILSWKTEVGTQTHSTYVIDKYIHSCKVLKTNIKP